MSVMSTRSRLPWTASVVIVVLIWCIIFLEMPRAITGSVIAKAIHSVNSLAEDEASQLRWDALENETLQSSELDMEIEPSPEPVSSEVSSNTATSTLSERPLVLYAYSESEEARFNIQFFINHGLHANADFVFIINGETNATSFIPSRPNIRIVERQNDCYDLGAHSEVLTTNDLYKQYKKFIMLNASIRGPFLPSWSEGCWTDMYLRRITEDVKLAGMTANCWPALHVQSMIWATDLAGLETLLFPPPKLTSSLSRTPTYANDTETITGVKLPPYYHGINSCFHDWGSAVAAEIGASALIRAAGYKIDVMMAAYHAAENYEDICDKERDTADVLWEGQYFGTNVHPFDTVFIKSNRGVDAVTVERLTQWTMSKGYSSYDYCKA